MTTLTNSTNISVSSCDPSRFDTPSSYAFIITAVSLLSLVGNVLVIAVIVRSPTLHTNQGYHMFSLAFSDLGSAMGFLVFSARYAIIRTYPDRDTLETDVGGFFFYLFLTCTLLNTIGIGLDKLAQIEAPFRYELVWTRSRCIAMLVSLWLLIAFLSLMPTRLFHIDNYNYEFNCFSMSFQTVLNVSGLPVLLITRCCLFVILLLILFLGYGRLFCIVRRHMRHMHHHRRRPVNGGEGGIEPEPSIGPHSSTTRSSMRTASTYQNRMPSKGAVVTGLILGAFVVFWTPYFLIVCIAAAAPQWSVKRLLRESASLNFTLAWFSFLHTSVNIIIYCGFYKPFRAGLKQLLRCPPTGCHRCWRDNGRSTRWAVSSTAGGNSTVDNAACWPDAATRDTRDIRDGDLRLNLLHPQRHPSSVCGNGSSRGTCLLSKRDLPI